MVTPAKVLTKWKVFEGDKVVWMILFFLAMISIIEVYSASSNMSYKTGYYWKPILQHASFFVLGGLAAIVIHKIPCRYFKLIPLVGIPVSVFMLIVVMFTTRVNAAARWFEVGGITFQPSEIVIRGISLGRLEQSVRVRNISGAISQIRDRHIAGLPLPLSGKLGGISP